MRSTSLTEIWSNCSKIGGYPWVVKKKDSGFVSRYLSGCDCIQEQSPKGVLSGQFNCDCTMCLILVMNTISQLRLIFGMFGIIGDRMDLMAIIQGKVKNENKTKASP